VCVCVYIYIYIYIYIFLIDVNYYGIYLIIVPILTKKSVFCIHISYPWIQPTLD
jgi:hypothetical protein